MEAEERLEAIRERMEAATEGPWSLFVGNNNPGIVAVYDDGGGAEIISWAGFDASEAPGDDQEPNAAFIAHARSDVPDLLAVAEAAREVVEADEGHGNPVDHSEAVSEPIDRLREAARRLREGADREAQCEKCGSCDVNTRYEEADRFRRTHRCQETNEEHLHRTCRNCGYEWCAALTGQEGERCICGQTGTTLNPGDDVEPQIDGRCPGHADPTPEEELDRGEENVLSGISDEGLLRHYGNLHVRYDRSVMGGDEPAKPATLHGKLVGARQEILNRLRSTGQGAERVSDELLDQAIGAVAFMDKQSMGVKPWRWEKVLKHLKDVRDERRDALNRMEAEDD